MKKTKVSSPKVSATNFAASIGIDLPKSSGPKICEWCGEEYTPKRKWKTSRFCKTPCRMAHYSANNITIPLRDAEILSGILSQLSNAVAAAYSQNLNAEIERCREAQEKR